VDSREEKKLKGEQCTRKGGSSEKNVTNPTEGEKANDLIVEKNSSRATGN